MTLNTESPYASHEAVFVLLPWYVNGSLTEQEQRQVDAHLRVCLVCRKEMAAQRRLAQHVRHEAALAISPTPSFERLLARIQREQAAAPRQPRHAAGVSRWLAAWFGKGAWVAVCASAVLFGVAAWQILPPDAAATATFHTVADRGSLQAYRRADLRVLFDPQMPAATRDALLHSLDAQLVDDTDAAGLVTVRLPDRQGAGLPQALAQLRAHPAVLFAEPALPLPLDAAGAQR